VYINTAEIFDSRDYRDVEGENSDKNVSKISGIKETVLGESFLVERILCIDGRKE
jgi:hypothetical protein